MFPEHKARAPSPLAEGSSRTEVCLEQFCRQIDSNKFTGRIQGFEDVHVICTALQLSLNLPGQCNWQAAATLNLVYLGHFFSLLERESSIASVSTDLIKTKSSFL